MRGSEIAALKLVSASSCICKHDALAYASTMQKAHAATSALCKYICTVLALYLHNFALYLHCICMGLHAYASPMQVRETTSVVEEIIPDHTSRILRGLLVLQRLFLSRTGTCFTRCARSSHCADADGLALALRLQVSVTT